MGLDSADGCTALQSDFTPPGGTLYNSESGQFCVPCLLFLLPRLGGPAAPDAIPGGHPVVTGNSQATTLGASETTAIASAKCRGSSPSQLGWHCLGAGATATPSLHASAGDHRVCLLSGRHPGSEVACFAALPTGTRRAASPVLPHANTPSPSHAGSLWPGVV